MACTVSSSAPFCRAVPASGPGPPPAAARLPVGVRFGWGRPGAAGSGLRSGPSRRTIARAGGAGESRSPHPAYRCTGPSRTPRRCTRRPGTVGSGGGQRRFLAPRAPFARPAAAQPAASCRPFAPARSAPSDLLPVSSWAAPFWEWVHSSSSGSRRRQQAACANCARFSAGRFMNDSTCSPGKYDWQ